MKRRRYFRLLLFLVLSPGVLLLYSFSAVITHQPTVQAHAFVIGSDPVDGSTIPVAPRVVRIFFNSAISAASIAHVYVFTTNAREVDAGASSVSASNPGELDTFLLPSTQLPQGGYEIQWAALSNEDGHTTHGLIGFNVGHSSTGLSGVATLGPSTSNCLPQLIGSASDYCSPFLVNFIGFLAVAWDWLILVAVTFWVGILVTEAWLLADRKRVYRLSARRQGQRRTLHLLCLVALSIGEIIALTLRAKQFTQTVNGRAFDFVDLAHLLFGTTYGWLWLVRLALIVLAIALLQWSGRQMSSKEHEVGRVATVAKFTTVSNVARGGTLNEQRTRSQMRRVRHRMMREGLAKEETQGVRDVPSRSVFQRRFTLIEVVLAGLVLLTLALTRDAAQLAQPSAIAIPLDWFYFVARSILLGGLSYIGYALLPAIEPDHYAETLLSLLQRFLPLLLLVVGVLLVTGLYLGVTSLSGLPLLLSDSYTWASLVEDLLIAFIIILSGYALFVLRPRLARQTALEYTVRRLKQTLNLLPWLGAGALLCAALMAFYAPPIAFPRLQYAQNSGSTLSSSSTPTVQMKQVGNMVITLQVQPSMIAVPHRVLVTLSDSGGNSIMNAQIQLSVNMTVMDMGTATASMKQENSGYVATFGSNATFTMSGLWAIVLQIQRPNQAMVTVGFSVLLGNG